MAGGPIGIGCQLENCIDLMANGAFPIEGITNPRAFDPPRVMSANKLGFGVLDFAIWSSKLSEKF